MGWRVIRTVVAVAFGLALSPCFPGHADADFGLADFSVSFESSLGGDALLAGSHPDVLISLDFNETVGPNGQTVMEGQLRDLEVSLPAGLFGNPAAVPGCTMEEIVIAGGVCGPAKQVGLLELPGPDYPVYNLVAPQEQVAVLGAMVLGIPAKIVLSVRTEGDFGLTAKVSNLNQAMSLPHATLILWGVPASPVHDKDRFGSAGIFDKGHPAGIEPRPFLSMPTRCEPLETLLRVDSWQRPGAWVSGIEGTPALTGCEALDFSPSLKVGPTTDVADSPSGLDLELEIPQSDDPEGRASAHLREARIELPPGLVVNPATANGLNACSPAQLALDRCPPAAKIGSAALDVQGFAQPFSASVFLATPHDNPFGSLLALYLVVEGRGLVAKLAGGVEADPETGRLTLTFRHLPQLPVEGLRLHLFKGPLAPLRTPTTCGTYAVESSLLPWSAPDTPSADPGDEYAIDRSPNAGACASSEARLPNSAGFEAGSSAPLAGRARPFELNLRREDGTQQISSLRLTMPPGLAADLAAVSTCIAPPDCPPGSRVGGVFAAAGAGPRPYNLAGSAYLGGPYKGAPLSLALVVPALAGPFDLGTVTVRAALDVDPTTAQITVRTDPLPQILEGIPLDVRSLSLRLDKRGFARNPTSCDPMAIAGTLTSTTGAAAPLRDRFQVGECGRLRFRPKLSLRLLGPTHRSAHPALRVVARNPGGADLKRIALAFPPSEYFDTKAIEGVCSRPRFAADACPRDSVYGHARAWSPLLDAPLEGPVYLRGSNHLLPDLVASLRGRFRIDLRGRLDSRAGRVRATFWGLPDVPISKFVLRADGGRNGLLVNNSELCRQDLRAAVEFAAHNGRTLLAQPAVSADCAAGGER